MMKPEYVCEVARLSDVDSWMKLVEEVKDDFPGLVLEDYRQTLLKSVAGQNAVCVKYQNEVVGALLYSVEHKALFFMAVSSIHRRKGVATALIEAMVNKFPKNSEVWVTTFREGDPKGRASRELYKRLGFIEGELVIEFDYLVQRLVLYT